mmetsp:Transcript_122633/g.318872  ORF Transcript_122633/g.318872 Transcript_122633/m.318872 type:complete len:380 (+) Transcript_122633:32-1171(+)
MSNRAYSITKGDTRGGIPLSIVRRNWSEAPKELVVDDSCRGDDTVTPQTAPVVSAPFTKNSAGIEEEFVAKGQHWASFEHEQPPYSNLPISNTLPLTHQPLDSQLIARPFVHVCTDDMQPDAGHVRLTMPQLLVGSKLGLVVKHLVVVAITNARALQLGFQPGDRVLAVNDNPVGSTSEFFEEVSRAMADNQISSKPVVFDIWRNRASFASSLSAAKKESIALTDVQANQHVVAPQIPSHSVPTAALPPHTVVVGDIGHAHHGNRASCSEGFHPSNSAATLVDTNSHLLPQPSTHNVARHGGRNLSRRKHVCPFRDLCGDEQPHVHDSAESAPGHLTTTLPASSFHQNQAPASRRRHLCGSSTTTKENLPGRRRAACGC